MGQKLAVFKGKQIRRTWDKKQEKWYFSVVDICGALTNSIDPGAYWRKLKQRLKEEGSQVVTFCHGLKFIASDGKYYFSDAANTETLFRIIQSIPSPKAEPFKQWLAKVGYERVQDISDPERSLNRARKYWQRMGRSQKWIQQRMMGQETRNKLTDYWQKHQVKEPDEYAILTNIIHREWSDLTIKQHKNLKGLRQQNLRDHMSEAELIFTALAEMSTRQIAETVKAKGLTENKFPARKGGRIAKHARLELEQKTGKSIITRKNYLSQKKEKLFKKT